MCIRDRVYRVTVVLVILSSIDTNLCSDGVCTARRVLDAEVEYSETHFAQRGDAYKRQKVTFVPEVGPWSTADDTNVEK